MINEQDKQRIEHRDTWSPVQVLQERKNQIDKYIARMDKVGTSGTFYDSYVLLSRDFNQAISELERSEKLLQEYREEINEMILWCEDMGYKPDPYYKLKSLLHQPNRAV